MWKTVEKKSGKKLGNMSEKLGKRLQKNEKKLQDS